MKNILATTLFFVSFAVSADTSPAEILDWYKTKFSSQSLPAICKIIQKDFLERKKSFFVISRHGWSVAESEAAYLQCEAENMELLNAKRAAEEAKQAAILEKEAQDLILYQTTEIPNIPSTYFNVEQANAYIFAVRNIKAGAVVSRTAYEPVLKKRDNFQSDLVLEVSSVRDVHVREMDVYCYHTVAGKEVRVSAYIPATSTEHFRNSTFQGPLKAGTNQIQIRVWFHEDHKFPVRDLVESMRCELFARAPQLTVKPTIKKNDRKAGH